MKTKFQPKIIGLMASVFAVITLNALPVGKIQSAFADGEVPQTIKVGYFTLDSFQEGGSDDAIKSGYAYEIYQKISDETGWKYQYEYGHWGELLQKFETGEIDLFAGLSYLPEREAYMEWSEIPIDNETHSIFIRKDELEISSINYLTLSGKRVGVIRDSDLKVNFDQWCIDHSVTCESVYYDDFTTVLDELEAGNVDACLGIDNMVDMHRQVKIFAEIAETPTYIAVKKYDITLRQTLNNALNKISEDDPSFFINLKKKYYSNSIVNISLTPAENNWVMNHVNLRIGYEEDYLPFSKTGSDGKPFGLITDIVDAWLDGLQLRGKFKIVYKPYADYDLMFEALENNQIDLVFPIMDNMWFAEQHGIIVASNIISSSIVAIYKDNFTERTLDTISYSSHSAIQEVCTNIYYPNANKVVYENRDQCLDAVLDGTVGCTLFNSSRAEMALRESKYSSLKMVSLGKSVDFSFAVRKGQNTLLSLVNRGISIMNTSDFNSKIFNYVSYSSEYTFQQFFRDNIFWLSLAIFVVLGLFATMQFWHARRVSKAYQEVKRANEARTSFFFNMSHDIRTPMNAILGFTDMGMKYIDDKDKVVECLQKTQRSGTLLLSLINNVLDMSKIESNKATLEENVGDVLLSFENIKTTMTELARAKDIELTFEFGNIRDRYVYVDFNKCIRVFTNLISNAIKYTQPGGKVLVTCEQLEKDGPNGYATYIYKVKDNGIGMSKEFQQHMFESFTRETNEATSSIEGNGLGLAVCNTYIHFMGGTIECESEQGRGTTFTITIPFKLQNGQSYTDPNTGEIVNAGEIVREYESHNFVGRRVLLVDDNLLNIEIAKDTLEEVGLLVDTADDGDTAVQILEEKGPNYYDFVLMDVQMPRMNGYEATVQIRIMYPHDDIIIIALSANAFEEDKEASLAAGMNDHIAKPIDKNLLFKTVSKYMK